MLRNLLARKAFYHLCSKIEVGSLKVIAPDGRERVFGSESSLTRGEMNVQDESVYYDLLTQGDWGLGWAFVHKKWDSKTPENVPLIFMLNEHVARPYVRRMMRLSPMMRLVTRQDRQNQSTREASRRKTVGQCYDVGNDFFEWVLGPSMVYTCAIWPRPDATLEEAQENKMRIVTEKAKIEPHHKVLELGCGWGTLANYIHEKTGASVKAIALSKQQINWAKAHYPNCEYEYLNYANATGRYDRIVSVGMGEHVGRDNYDRFMRLVCDLLEPGGRFVMHTMLGYDDLLMLSNKDRWISFASVVMPNGDVPTMTNIARAAMKTGMLRVVHTETFGIHYARTARAWRDGAIRNRQKIIERYSEELYRIYLYAWAMGSAAAETGMNLVHVVFEKKPFGSPVTESIL